MADSLTMASIKTSVLIPTHNRSSLLRNTLEALCRQSLPVSKFEVIVVADGCTDDTASVAQQFQKTLQLRLIQQPHSGPAMARNLASDHARGPVLIFLDDDIEAQPELLEAHVLAHEDHNDLVLIGYLPPVLKNQRGFFRIELLGWWEEMFQKMRQPGHRFAYMDLLSGNFSISADLFKRAGKFNPDFRVHEDYELGVRLHRMDVVFANSSKAAGFHQEDTDLPRALSRKYEEGRSEVRLGQLYPELIPTLLMARLKKYSLLPSRILEWFAFSFPGAGDQIARFLQNFLALFERTRAFRTWQRLLYGLLGYWYWRGVAEELSSQSELKKFLSTKGKGGRTLWSILEVDLAGGVDQAELLLDERRPDGLILKFNHHSIGFIPPQPGGEKLRAAHLRPLLASDYSAQLLRALAIEGVLGIPEITERVIGLCDEVIRQYPQKNLDYD